jgi:hypothetical protein
MKEKTMQQKRLAKKLVDIIPEIKNNLLQEFSITQEILDQFRAKVDGKGVDFPSNVEWEPIETIWIDYEVQRDVILKHVVNIMRKFDPRVCMPAAGVKILKDGKWDGKLFTYDGQHRIVALALLGYDSVPCCPVETDDPAFASYAFELLNDTGVKRLTPADLHRNSLTRYKLGSREIKSVQARTLQDQFDTLDIDLEDKKTRSNPNTKGTGKHFFSHFKYAYKGIELDKTGNTLHDILESVTNTFPNQEEVDQGVYIGLYELSRLSRELNIKLPQDWLDRVLKTIKDEFGSSHTAHTKAKRQWEYIRPGASWSAPEAMCNFIREVYLVKTSDTDKLELPTHGKGSSMEIETNNVCQGFWSPLEMVAVA